MERLDKPDISTLRRFVRIIGWVGALAKSGVTADELERALQGEPLSCDAAVKLRAIVAGVRTHNLEYKGFVKQAPRIRFYDRSGEPISSQRCGELRQDTEYSTIAHELLEGTEDLNAGFWVSTVWIGVDLRSSGDRPMIFETLVRRFGKNVSQRRYATEEEARTGHEEAVVSARGLQLETKQNG